jgi:membrane peptidoglycan carboxypeptidase
MAEPGVDGDGVVEAPGLPVDPESMWSQPELDFGRLDDVTGPPDPPATAEAPEPAAPPTLVDDPPPTVLVPRRRAATDWPSVVRHGATAASRAYLFQGVTPGVAAGYRGALIFARLRMAAAADDVQRRIRARLHARRVAAARREAARQAALRHAARRRAALRQIAARRALAQLIAKERRRRARRRRIALASTLIALVLSVGAVAGLYYVDEIPSPEALALPESTTVYFSDGVTPMARLGRENRTILDFDEINDAATQAIVAAEDRTFWTNDGVDLSGVARALWNNATGGTTQGASTITAQYVRIAADLNGMTYSRKAREAILSWKIDKKYSKKEILAFYLNTVPFGRGAYGIEAAAQAYFGKTVRRTAPPEQQVDTSEAMLLAALVKQPEPNPADPDGEPGYDPARGGRAAANALSRWEYVREGMVVLGYLSAARADELTFPHTVLGLGERNQQSLPIGLAVSHVLSELWHSAPFRDQPPDYLLNGGFRIVTTVDKRVQDAAEAAADIRRLTAPAIVRGQPADWQAALVAIEPGTGRVLAYYGGNDGIGSDYAGWFYDADGAARGYGQHPPGSSFKVYTLAEALRQRISLSSRWDSPAVKEFPSAGRTTGSPSGPVRNASTAPCQPKCTLTQATVASLNTTFFALTERLGPANVIEMAERAGIESLWTDRTTAKTPQRIDLSGRRAAELVAKPATGKGKALFTTEVGIGQYGVTVLDHANGMATFAAGGRRATAHFVREVTRAGQRVYAEPLTQQDIGLGAKQLAELTSTLRMVPSADLGKGWQAAGKTGTWEAGRSLDRNAHTWMVGYARPLAAAVWLGTTDGKALRTSQGKYNVFGSTYAAPIWRQFMVTALAVLGADPKIDVLAAPSPTPTRHR